MFEILFGGFLGGLVRGLVGFIKHQQSYKEVPLRPWYLLSTIALSGGIGLLVAYISSDLGLTFFELTKIPFSLAVVIGYAGGDLLENIYKIGIKSPTIYPLK